MKGIVKGGKRKISKRLIREWKKLSLLNSKILDQGLWEKKFTGCFVLSLAPAGGTQPAGPYPSPFPNPAVQR